MVILLCRFLQRNAVFSTLFSFGKQPLLMIPDSQTRKIKKVDITHRFGIAFDPFLDCNGSVNVSYENQLNYQSSISWG